jgi:hypothetical protein
MSMNPSPTVGVNAFALRHTPESPFSHFSGTPEELCARVVESFGAASPGYRPGVFLVPVSPEGFYSGIVALTPGTDLKATFEARRADEDPFTRVEAVGADKLPAKTVDIVVYSRGLLDESKEERTGCDWDIISINASTLDGPEPMSPVAMARNFLGLPGGTKATFTAEEFAKAIMFWATHAHPASR